MLYILYCTDTSRAALGLRYLTNNTDICEVEEDAMMYAIDDRAGLRALSANQSSNMCNPEIKRKFHLIQFTVVLVMVFWFYGLEISISKSLYDSNSSTRRFVQMISGRQEQAGPELIPVTKTQFELKSRRSPQLKKRKPKRAKKMFALEISPIERLLH